MNYDAYIVGCGLTGSVIARALAESGKKVVMFERRDHVAGNMYDEYDKNGILVQKYGPHAFHTNKQHLVEYLQRFGEWEPYRLTCMVWMNGKFTPSPFNYQTIDDYFPPEKAARIKACLETEFPGRTTATIVELLESKDALVKEYADYLFEYDYKLYTAKQWGVPPSEIDISVLKRVPVRLTYDVGYFDDEFQILPKGGYTGILRNVISHENITVHLNTNACDHFYIENTELHLDGQKTNAPVYYSGAPDELFRYKFGELPYRSLRFEYETHELDSFQDAPIVAYPQEPDFTRITEYKKLPIQDVPGVTTIAREFPLQSGQGAEPYYPLLTEENMQKYEMYRCEAEKVGNLHLCGRLGDYKYYNMDQALEKALSKGNDK